jgi:hypothetical protein
LPGSSRSIFIIISASARRISDDTGCDLSRGITAIIFVTLHDDDDINLIINAIIISFICSYRPDAASVELKATKNRGVRTVPWSARGCLVRLTQLRDVNDPRTARKADHGKEQRQMARHTQPRTAHAGER